jgi:hypothetical protein
LEGFALRKAKIKNPTLPKPEESATPKFKTASTRPAK